MNTINFINIFYVATQNIFMAVFITMIITRIFIKNFADYMVKRNISKNTLIDDKFFNWPFFIIILLFSIFVSLNLIVLKEG